jgi:hypothetical protein
MTLDVWTPSQIEIFTEYALGNNEEVKELLSGSEVAFGIVQNLMMDKHSNSLIRERVVARIENLIHSHTMHNYDAYNTVLNRVAEEKNEQHSTSDSRINQVTGGAVFGGATDTITINRLVNDNPLVYTSGWIDGRLAYTARFDFNDSDIEARLRNTACQRQLGKKTAPKFLWSDWIKAESLKITFLNEEYLNKLKPYITTPLFYGIRRIWTKSTIASLTWPIIDTDITTHIPSHISSQDQCLFV